MTQQMQSRFAQFAAVERCIVRLEAIKNNVASARKGARERSVEGWAAVRDEAHKQLCALQLGSGVAEVGVVAESELPLAQKEAK